MPKFMLFEGVREDEKSGERDRVYLAQGKVPQQVKIPNNFLSDIIEYFCSRETVQGTVRPW
jgi:hypothetical protein